MTRRTVTLTAPNGAKVRTVWSKTYYTIRYGDLHVRTVREHPYDIGVAVRLDPPEPYASVDRRSDNLDACRAAARKCGNAVVVRPRLVDIDGKQRLVASELYRYEAGVLVANSGLLA